MLPSLRKFLGSVRAAWEVWRSGFAALGRQSFHSAPAVVAGPGPHPARTRPSAGRLWGRRRLARTSARACAPPRPRLSCGDSAAPPAAPASLLHALRGERRLFPGPWQRWSAPLRLNQSIHQTSIAPRNLPRRRAGGLPAPSPPLSPAASPPPLRAAGALHAEPLRSASWLPPPLLRGFSNASWREAARVEEEDQSLEGKFAARTSPGAGHR